MMREIITAFVLGLTFAASILTGFDGLHFGFREILLVVVFPALALIGLASLLIRYSRRDELSARS
nr:hypothetical protein GCM10023233_34390 [Brevibacterium otitidis]